VISFSIFDCKHDWQFLFYLRGLWFNCAMIRLLKPEYKIYVSCETNVYLRYENFFDALIYTYGIELLVMNEDTLCRMMLWRMKPVFNPEVEYCFCRDTDSLVTWRDMGAMQQFIDSGRAVSGVQDNPGHTVPLMGGMSGFKCEPLRQQYGTWNEMISRSPVKIDRHGSDQDFLTRVVYEDFKGDYLLQSNVPRKRDDPRWLSDLCVPFIGSAGVNEFETLRYLRDNKIDLTLNGIGKLYPNIFYWL
jgi:hypothetical protein